MLASQSLENLRQEFLGLDARARKQGPHQHDVSVVRRDHPRCFLNHRRLVVDVQRLLAQQGEPQIDEVDGASQLDKGKQLGRGTEQGRQTEGRRQHMHHGARSYAQCGHRTRSPALRATAQHDEQGVRSRHHVQQQAGYDKQR